VIQTLSQPEHLNSGHIVDSFDCGKDPLNDYLKRLALQSQNGGFGTTFVVHEAQVVQGFYTTCASALEVDDAPERMIKGGPPKLVPVWLLGRLAVDSTWIGKGLGPALLHHVFRRFLSLKDEVGMKAIVTDAKDDQAKAFYVKHGFTEFEGEPMKLYILPKNIRQQLARTGVWRWPDQIAD
jgi:GNAT superfamily N-acetyltransferase